MHSAIYQGSVWHRRLSPRVHRFRYQVSMLYLDLAEVDALLGRAWFWSARRPALAWLRRKDFIGPRDCSIDEAVRRRIAEESGERHRGPIRVLANLRFFGFIMNPLVCYYCFDEQEQLRYVVAEVTNTPWGQKHSYVLRCDPAARVQRINFQKRLHVSPFNHMDVEYHWRNSTPGENLQIHIANVSQGQKQFAAGMSLQRHELSELSLEKMLLRYPFETLKVAGGIYWQALKLFAKGVPFVSHPGKHERIEQQSSG